MRLSSLLLSFGLLSTTQAAQVNLEDLNVQQIGSGWNKSQADKSVEGNTLQIGGQDFKNGVGTHADSMAIINLDGKGTNFTAFVGVDDEVGKGKGSVDFIVRGDGKELFRSGIMKSGDKAKKVNVNLKGVKTLVLEAQNGGDGIGADHANWADAQISYDGAKPKLKASTNLADYGFRPNSHENATVALRKALEALKGKKNITLVFPKGRYDFWQNKAFEKEVYISNHSDVNPKKIAFLLEGFDGITIDGQGSEFIFHGEMIPFEIIDSKKVTLKNFSIDWERPTFSQGSIEAIGEDYFDFKLSDHSWYKIQNDRLFFYGEGWGAYGGWLQAHDGETGRLIYRLGDGAGIRGGLNVKAKEIAPGVVRLWNKLPKIYKKGDVIVARHLDRNNPGFHIYRSKDTVIENVDLHFACAMGVIGQRSENITLKKFRIIKPEGSGRRMTTFADGTHFSGCKGLIHVEDSYFEHMFDDAINVHGTYVQIQEKTSAKSLKARFREGQAKALDNAGPGDKVMLIDNETMLPYATLTVKSFKNIGLWEMEYTFEEEVPARMKAKDGLENITWTPEVIFRRNKVVHNRARGMLFNGAGKMIVEDNYVQTSGSAILVAGDCNGWFESGPVGVHGPLIIRNNVFDACLTTAYQFTHAQIAIDPVIPKTVLGGDTYHKDIFIENNVFKVFDAPILFARSVKGLHFTGNTIEQVKDYKPWHYNKHMFNFEACKDVNIKNTKLIGKPLAKDVKLLRTAKEEIKEDMNLEFK